MFNNVIYFIVVLFIFNISYSVDTPENPLSYSIFLFSLTWLIFAGICRWGFGGVATRFSKDQTLLRRLTRQYHGMVLRLSILAIFLFALDVYMFHLKYWLQLIPGVKQFSVLLGVLALMVFIFYLATIWYFAHPVYSVAFQTEIGRRSFLVSHFKFNVPIVFPWLVLSLLYDLMALTSLSGKGGFMDKPAGQILFFAVFLVALMIFLPRFIQQWWGCRPFETTDKVRELKTFILKTGFRYRDLLKWPIFEGRIMTAGIMGIVPRYRYLLITDALMEILSVEELKAVVAHEMGHAKYRHVLFYILFVLGYIVLTSGLFDPDLFSLFFAAQPFFQKLLESGGSQAMTLFYLFLSLPILLTLVVYFRYVMGFFMRNFERQADLESAVAMGSPRPTISSLEKIALLSGNSRDLPSWHHFSIKDRVEFLWRFLSEPGLVKKHNRKVALCFGFYLIALVSLGYLLNSGPVKQNLKYYLGTRVLDQRLEEEPDNIMLHKTLAEVYHEMGRYPKAIQAYERVILLDRSQAGALNNLAWVLVTIPDEQLRDKKRALSLAKEAVGLERSSIFLDTLAEAYFANGLTPEAVRTIKEAIAMKQGNGEYYLKQLEKFMGRSEK